MKIPRDEDPFREPGQKQREPGGPPLLKTDLPGPAGMQVRPDFPHKGVPRTHANVDVFVEDEHGNREIVEKDHIPAD